jgi:succinate dehydrogenase hydrophobic anchor subunit
MDLGMTPGATIAVGIGAAVLAFLVFVLVFRWIWNSVVPDVFGFKAITFWQAVGILILASILFGGHRVINADITGGAAKRSQALPLAVPA